ncbi:oligopeptide transporter, OPT superfamily [Artemisia annua]|uniref:Oligopeptide transporter, OPT superfamily n=1 Tax=Artemisia annua TaxID=35608 RepID=A0A2U1NGX3_ARTAN|nr:oligopeptide transporter, OPT superfamily [Artemisia annua]
MENGSREINNMDMPEDQSCIDPPACATRDSVAGLKRQQPWRKDALNKKTYEQAGVDTAGNSPGSYKEPGIGWMTGFCFIMIIGYKLTYPSGTATAVLINGFHTPKGDKMARKFCMGLFQWFYSGSGTCGFTYFPTFGLKAYANSFYFDFSMTYIGAGMICSHLVNLSLLAGGVLSYGVMWPLIGDQKGDWFPSSLPQSSMKSLNGYKVFISIALILGDGLYNFLKITFFTARNIYTTSRKNPKTNPNDSDEPQDNLQRNEVFLKKRIPFWVAATALGFCNAYGAGLTDMNMVYNYGKVTLFVIASMSGKENGLVAGLIGCGLIKSIVSISSDLMHDLKTGHLTMTSPRSMVVVSQAIGTAIGCVVAPLTFFLFYKAFDVGNPEGEYKAPYALVYRNMAILGVEGFSALPQHCLQLSYGFFTFAILANMVRDMAPNKIGKWVPLPMAMAVPFLVGAYFAIDMCVGSLVVFVWSKINKKKAELMVPAVASGLICGDGLWILRPLSLHWLGTLKNSSQGEDHVEHKYLHVSADKAKTPVTRRMLEANNRRSRTCSPFLEGARKPVDLKWTPDNRSLVSKSLSESGMGKLEGKFFKNLKLGI